MDKTESIEEAIHSFQDKHHELSIFMNGISQWFSSHPELSKPGFPIVHSVKARLKDPGHLREKLHRGWDKDNPVNADNLFTRITDLAGVRVLHLYQDQFKEIHSEILRKVNTLGDWHLPEPPKAYTWDPESQQFFDGLGVGVQVKESFYTSVHYLIRPRQDSPLCCEIQVRTLFEEIWGEVDHGLNYPTPSSNISCREQLRVLAKLVGAGSRLVDSIFRSSGPT
jgi:ppGpp synthetase/RelA/SpoT-type nucleotidyltranferase